MTTVLETIGHFVEQIRAREVHRAFVTGAGIALGTDRTLAFALDGLAPYQLLPYLALYITAYAVFEFFYAIKWSPFKIEKEPPWKDPIGPDSPLYRVRRWFLAAGVSTLLISGSLLVLFTRNVWLYDSRYVAVAAFTNDDLSTLHVDGLSLAIGVRDALAASSVLTVAPDVHSGFLPLAATGQRRDKAFPLVLSGNVLRHQDGGVLVRVFIDDLGSRGRREVYQGRVPSSRPSDLLVAHREIAHAVVRRTQAWTLALQRRQPPDVAVARQYSLAYQHLQYGSSAEINAALPSFELALQIDTTSIAARSGRATAHALLAYHNEHDREANYDSASKYADAAIGRSGPGPTSDLAGAYTARGLVSLYRDRDLLEARVAFRTALQMDPKFLPPYEHLAKTYLYERRFDDARRIVRAGLAVDSSGIALQALRGQIPYFAGEYDSARVLLGALTDAAPCVVGRGVRLPILRAYRTLGNTHLAAGRAASAIDAFRESAVACREGPRPGTILGPPTPCDAVRGASHTAHLARGIAAAGDKQAAESLVQCVKVQYPAETAPYQIALYHAASNAPYSGDSVITWLRIAEECRDAEALSIRAEPLLDRFRASTEVRRLTALIFDAGRAREARKRTQKPPTCLRQG